jgi:hypothetical protein
MATVVSDIGESELIYDDRSRVIAKGFTDLLLQTFRIAPLSRANRSNSGDCGRLACLAGESRNSDYLRKEGSSKVKASKVISRSLPAFMAAMPGNGVIALRYRAQRFSVKCYTVREDRSQLALSFRSSVSGYRDPAETLELIGNDSARKDRGAGVSTPASHFR